jgi:transcriptional regulator with XRE-family HTH domain
MAQRTNRVREFRKQRGLTIVQLAEKARLSHPYLVRIEGGQRGLSIPVAERLAQALEVPVNEILGLSASGSGHANGMSLSEDAEPYVPSADDRVEMKVKRGKTVDPWLIKSNAVDLAGIAANTVVFVDISAEAVESIEALKCVIAQVYDQQDLTKARTVVRQFVPPSLLITNSSGDNDIPLDINRGEAYIKGVIIGGWSRF